MAKIFDDVCKAMEKCGVATRDPKTILMDRNSGKYDLSVNKVHFLHVKFVFDKNIYSYFEYKEL